MQKLNTVVFDFGGVLIDWNPEYVFKEVIPDDEKRAWFFENICTSDWNEEQDAGRSLEEATELLVSQHPDYELEIRAFYGRWEEMLGDAIAGTVEILREIKTEGRFRLLGLTNWSAETFPVALERFEFLQWFEGIVVSGTEKTRKPFKKIYDILINRYELTPEKAIFIDDNLRNVKAAKEVGLEAIHFLNPEKLRKELEKMGVL